MISIVSNLKQGVAFADQTAASLRLRIVAGELADGQKLSENTIAAEFGLSRGPVREALKALEYEGLVNLTRQGVVVRGLTEHDLDELYDVRYMLERYCLTHIDRQLMAGLADRLLVIVDRMELALQHQDAEEYSRQDIDFHNLPFELLEHRFIRQFWENIRGLHQTVLYIGTKKRFEQGDFEYKQEATRKHREMANAVATGELARIESSLLGHFSRISWHDKKL